MKAPNITGIKVFMTSGEITNKNNKKENNMNNLNKANKNLYLATIKGYNVSLPSWVKQSFDEGADANLIVPLYGNYNIVVDNKVPLIMKVVKNVYIETAKLFIVNGLDVNIKVELSDSVKKIFNDDHLYLIEEALLQNRFDIVKLLATNGANTEIIFNKFDDYDDDTQEFLIELKSYISKHELKENINPNQTKTKRKRVI